MTEVLQYGLQVLDIHEQTFRLLALCAAKGK